ncbi:hypothetical protein HDU89_001712, partial [Geranomyces variabilis]
MSSAADVSKLHEFTELLGKYLIATRMFSNEELRKHLPFYLTTLARQWFQRLKQQGELMNLTYLEIFEKMKTEFLGQNQKDNARARLKKLTFTGLTTLYYTAFRRLAEDARITGGTDPIPASDMLKMFLDGYECGGAIGRDIRNALMAKRAFEADITMDLLMAGADSFAQMMGLVDMKGKRNGEDVRPDFSRRSADVNHTQVQRGRGSTAVRIRGAGGRGNGMAGARTVKRDLTCYNCNKKGHFANECHDRRRGPEVNN